MSARTFSALNTSADPLLPAARYVDTATTSTPTPTHSPSSRPRQLLHLPRSDPQRQALLKLVDQNRSGLEVAWNPRKMEVLKGEGMLGYREGLYAYHSFAS